VALLLLLLASGAVSEPPASWLTFRDAEAGFAVDFPASPVRTRSSQLTVAGRIHLDVLVAFLDRTEFRVERVDVPAVARWMLSEQGLLERALGDQLSDEGAVSVREMPERFGDHPARRATYTDDHGRPGEVRFILAGHRLVLMAILWPEGDIDRAGRERFFASLSLPRGGRADRP
jgi:hypothetical protein